MLAARAKTGARHLYLSPSNQDDWAEATYPHFNPLTGSLPSIMRPYSPKENVVAYDDDDIYYVDAMQSRPSLNGQKMAVTIEPMEPMPPRMLSPASGPLPGPRLYQNNFFSHDATITAARKQYFKMFIGGTVLITLLIFGVFSILWGAFYRTPVRALPGWIVDFDGGIVGQAVTSGLTIPNPTSSRISWTVIPPNQFVNGASDVSTAVVEQKTWIAVTINAGASNRLTAALATPNASYNGSQAITIFGNEARNENAYRVFLRPTSETALSQISARFAQQLARTLANSQNLPQLLSTSPQTITTPIGYQLNNLIPFNQPIATVVTFIGLIFLLILSFFIVMIGNAAREVTNLRRLLSLRSLIALRLTTCFAAYSLLSLFYSLLSIAFQLNVSRKFGRSGFLIFWMINFCAMCALGLALEAVVTLIGPGFIAFFMLTWIITNVAVTVFPIEVLPIVYRYGYAVPFHNVSGAVRTIVFGIKNEVGLHFGVLIIWAAVSCVTLPLFQFLMRRQDMAATKRQLYSTGKEKEG